MPLVARQRTIGRLYDASGAPVDELLYSASRGPGAGGPGLRGDWQRSEALTEHAEGHAAAVMREHGTTDATLYLNKHPCRKPAGCHYNIEKRCHAAAG